MLCRASPSIQEEAEVVEEGSAEQQQPTSLQSAASEGEGEKGEISPSPVSEPAKAEKEQ